MAKPDVSQLRTLLDTARHISLLLPQKPNFDVVAAALGLKLSLESAGKLTRVVCPDAMVVEFNRLVGIDTVVNTLGNRNLVISFPGQTELVDKVSYNIDKGELQLVITPKNQNQEIDHTRLKIAPPASKTDLILLMGIDQMSDLGPVYEESKNHFQTTTIISVHHQFPKENFTPHQAHDYDASSLSEVATHIIDSLGLTLTEDSASNLLLGLERATQNFRHHKVSASTFEAAVILMRKGAHRQQELSPDDFPSGSIPSISDIATISNPPSTTSAKTGGGQTRNNSALSGYGMDSDDLTLTSPAPIAHQKPPADWYEPKIYKGPMLP